MIHAVWAGSQKQELNDALTAWCAAKIGLPRGLETPCTAMGVFDDATLIAVIAYNNYNPEAGVIEFHGASITPRWLTRSVLHEMFDYPFNQIGCQMVITRNSENNKRLHRVLKEIGCKRVIVPRLRGRDEAECIWWLTVEAWRENKFNAGN